MKTLKNIFLVLISAAFLSGCSNDNYVNCNETIAVGVEDVTGPTTATVGQAVTFQVSFEVESNCGNFLSFSEEETATNEKTITTTVKYEGCTCGTTPVMRTAPYSFTVMTAGTYVLKFKITNNTFKTVTIVVT